MVQKPINSVTVCETQESRHDAQDDMVSLRQRATELEHALQMCQLAEETGRKQAEAELQRRGAILEAVGRAAEHFLGSSGLQHNIQALLERLGSATGVCRVYVFETRTSNNSNSDLTVDRRYVWIDPTAKVCPMLPVSFPLLPGWAELLRNGTPIYATAATLPVSEHHFLELLGGHSLVLVPIFVRLRWWGFIGFDETRENHSWTPLEIDAVKAAAGIIGAAIQRHQVEIMLEKNEAELRKLYRAVEQSPNAMIITDTNGIIEYVNARFTEMTDYTFWEAVGQELDTLQPCWHPSTTYRHRWETVAVSGEWRGEHYSQKKNGAFYWEHIAISPITNAHGTITHFLVVKEDITERKQAQEKLLQQQRALAVLREREHMARELHDNIGQVLGFLNMQAQTIAGLLSDEQRATVAPYLERLITVTQESQADIREFILGVSAGSDLGFGAEHLETERRNFFLSLEQYIQQVSQMYPLSITLLAPPDVRDKLDRVLIPPVAVHLLRIVQEALTNARKHASASHIHITFTLQHDDLVVVVRDNGSGFDMSEIGMSQPEHHCGSRYGLRSMRQRAEEIGASFQIDSIPTCGTSVTVQIPLVQHRSIPEQRILIVDDHPLFREGLHAMLTSHGLNVIGIACDGHEAFEQARQLQPDLILMDIRMPRCDGLEATRMIKAILPHIQIVMLTTADNDDLIFDTIKSGASGFLLKNLSAHELLESLQMLARGETFVTTHLASKVLGDLVGAEATTLHGQGDPAGDTAPEVLNERQIEILTLVSQGHIYREIGGMLHISERTVKYHMGEIIRRLQLKNRAEVIAYATRRIESGEWQTA